MLPECLDDWIDESNPVRALDAFVDALDLAKLGFEGVAPEVTGRPLSDPDLVPFEPPDHPTIRAAFRNVIESYPRALYDEQGLVRYRTRFLDSVLVSEPELIHDILVARADLFRRDDVARQLLSPMLGPTSLFMAEGADWKWQRRAVAPTFRHDKLLALVPTFSTIAMRQVERWRAAPREQPVDVAEAMAQTTAR